MKKLFLFMMAAMLIAFTSCVKDDMDAYGLGGEQTIKLSVEMPKGKVETRAAYSEPTEKNMRLFVYVLYDGEIVQVVENGTTHNFTSNYTKDIRVVPGKAYKLAVWADFGETYYTVTGAEKEAPKVAMASSSDAASNAEGSSITIEGSDNKRDAYYAIEDLNITENQTKEVKLKRPFGLVKISTVDYENEAVVNAGLLPEKYSTTIEDIPTEMSLVDGTLIVGSKKDVTISGNVANIEGENANGELSYDYFFATDNQENLPKFTMVYSDASDDEIVSYEFTNIPIRRNYKTNVSGNILTKKGSVEVKIEQDWTGDIDKDFVVYPASGAYNNTTNKTYKTLAEAIADASNNSGKQVISLAEGGTYDEVIGVNSTKANLRTADTGEETIIKIVSSSENPATVKGLYLNSGKYEVENVIFNGKGGYSTGSTVYVGQTADVILRNCKITPENLLTENSQARPVETETNFSGSFVLDGCTVNTNSGQNANFSYLNAAANDGAIQILNSTFDDVLAAEYYSSMKYAVIKGNTFAKTVDFTPASEEKTNSNLSSKSKSYVNGIIENNTFSGENKVAAYFGAEPTYYNEVIELGPVVNETAGTDFETIAAAITAANSEDIIKLAANTTFEEIITNNQKNISIIGQEGTKVKAAYLNGGNTTLENIEFYGAGMSAGSYSTVFAGGSATVNLKNCIVNVTEVGGDQARPIETAYNAPVNVTIDGCTVTANDAKNVYLNHVAKGGSMTVKNSTFVDKGITAEYNVDENSAKILPVIVNNNFGGNSVGFSYYSDPKIDNDSSKLDFQAKIFCNNILNNNTFTGENKVKVSPVNPWSAEDYFWVNTQFEFSSGTVIYENTLTAGVGDWSNATLTEGGTTVEDGAFSRSGEYRSQWLGNWTQTLDVYVSNDWVDGDYFDLVSSANNTSGNHAGQDQGLAMLYKNGKYYVSMTTSNSGVDSEEQYDDVEGKRNSEVFESLSEGWYTVTWKYSRINDNEYKCDMSFGPVNGNSIINFTFNKSGEALALNRYIWLTKAEETAHSKPDDAKSLKIRNQKIVLD